MNDSFGREINYLRISLTSKCNFRCKYCMPKTPFKWQPHNAMLSYEELFFFVKVAIDEGVNKIRITGGEPLMRRDVDKFVAMISAYKPDIDLAMTTNGYFLAQMAKKLKDAGLKRLNISLDTLNPKTAEFIAQRDVLGCVLQGIDVASELGFKLKFNSVALKNINENELVNLLDFAMSKNAQIRFIEFMENTHANDELTGLKADEILQIIAKTYHFISVAKETNSPSSLFMLDNGYKFGIISPHKHDFCESCNRIRLSAEGLLIPCLYFADAMSIKKAVEKKDFKEAAEIFARVINSKPQKNEWNSEISSRAFYETGG